MKLIGILCIIPVLCFMSCDSNPIESEQKVYTVTIGFTTSQTGNYSLLSTRQTNGLKLWMDQVNAAGGISLNNGLTVMFESVSYDDESAQENVEDLYIRLVTEDKVDFLFSPYSSGLTDAAALVADQYGKLLITAGAASNASHEHGYTSVFQTYTPASRYLTGAVDLLSHLDNMTKKIAYVFENLEYSTIVVESTRTYAEDLGYETVLFENYEVGTTDFESYINEIVASEAEIVLGGGHFQDGSHFAQQLYEKQVEIDFFTLLVAPPDPDFTDIGDAALGVIGPSQWEPSVAFSPGSASEIGVEWFGPLGEKFVQDYKTAYEEEPSYHSMGGYAAGLILEKAILDADTTGTTAVITALDSMDILTCYGRIKFESNAEIHGLQIGHDMIYIQWQQDDKNDLVKQVVWPLEGATAEAIYPKP
ncbi:amino acid ABC transporter substrate-binding protein [bacterium]